MDDGDVAIRVDWALRTSLAVLFAAIFQSTVPEIELPAFGAFVAVMALERNFGRTVANVRACVVGSAVAALLCTFWLALLRDHIVAMHAAHAASAYLLARWSSLPTMAQKLGLSLLPLILVNGFNPAGRQDLRFPLDLFVTVLMGCGCATVASLAPLPHVGRRLGFRAASARSRLVESRNASLELVGLLLHSLVRAFCAEPEASHWRSRVRRDALGRRLRKEATHIRSRAKDSEWEVGLDLARCGRNQRYAFDDAQVSDALLEAVTGLTVAEQAILENTSTGVMDHFLRFLQPPIEASLDAVMALLAALQDRDTEEGRHASGPLRAQTQRIEAAAQGVVETQRVLQAEYRRARHEIYYKEGVRAVPITHDALLSLNVFLFYYAYTVDSVMQAAHAAIQQNAIRKGMQLSDVVWGTGRSCVQVARELSGTFKSMDPQRDALLRSTESQDAFKIALAMALAGLFDATMGRVDPPPALAAFTVAYVCLSPTLSGNVNLAKLRLSGTIAGSIFSSVVLSLPAIREERTLLVLLLCLFVAAAGYVRSSAAASYAGTVAAFTAPVLMLGFNDPNTRIEHTVVGIVIFVVVDLALFPKPSTTIARAKLRSALGHLEDALYALYAGFGPEPVSDAGDRTPSGQLSPKRRLLTPVEQSPPPHPELARASTAPELTLPPPDAPAKAATAARVDHTEQREARQLLLTAAADTFGMPGGPRSGVVFRRAEEESLRGRARELLAAVSVELQQLAGLITAAAAEPRFLRPAFPSEYMRGAVTSARSVQAHLALALTAFDALERRMAEARSSRNLVADDEAAPLTRSLGLGKDEDPTFRGLLRPLGGPLAVFSAELALCLRAAVVDAGKLAAASRETVTDADGDLAAYAIDKKASREAFLTEYDHICRMLQPKRLAQPDLPLMSNVEVEAVNAIVFCLIEAMSATDHLMTAVGRLGEYQHLYAPPSRHHCAAPGDCVRQLNLTHRLLMAVQRQARGVARDKDSRDGSDDGRSLDDDPEIGAPGRQPSLKHWSARRQSRLHWTSGIGESPRRDELGMPRPPLVIQTRPYLQPTRVLVTATGPDRVGIVADVTEIVFSQGASVASSQMLRLGGDFCLMLMAVCRDARRASQLREGLHQASTAPRRSLGLQIVTKVMAGAGAAAVVSPNLSPVFANAGATANLPVEGQEWVGHVRLLGRDQPGLVFKLTRLLARNGISVERMHTEKLRLPAGATTALFGAEGAPVSDRGQEDPEPDADGELFVLSATVSARARPTEGIRQLLTELGEELSVTVELETE